MKNIHLGHLIIGKYGGAENFFFRLCDALNNRGIKQHLIVNADLDFLDQVKKLNLPYTVFEPHKVLRFIDEYKISRICKKNKINTILAWMNRAARRLPANVDVKIGRLGGWYDIKNFRKCDCLIGNSPSVVEFITKSGWDPSKTHLISNFVNLRNKKSNIKSELAIPNNSTVILALGRLDKTKGFDNLITSIKSIESSFLILAGKGEFENDLRRLTNLLDLSNRVAFLGWRDDIEDLFSCADMFVIPSLSEPFGNVIIEAWNMKVPVISSDAEGPSWLIENDVNGLIYEKDDIEGLTKCIQRLESDADLRCKLISNAYRKWISEYSEESICDKYIKLFDSLLNSGQVPH